jgi:hypothetical protein
VTDKEVRREVLLMGAGGEDLSVSRWEQTKVNMGLWRRDATRNTCVKARAYTEMFTLNARMMQVNFVSIDV